MSEVIEELPEKYQAEIRAVQEGARDAIDASDEDYNREEHKYEGEGKPRFAKDEWVPYEGPQGGEGWRNTRTEEVVYQDEKPGSEAYHVSVEDHADASFPEAESFKDAFKTYGEAFTQRVQEVEEDATAKITLRDAPMGNGIEMNVVAKHPAQGHIGSATRILDTVEIDGEEVVRLSKNHMSISEEYQGQGIGSSLEKDTIQVAGELANEHDKPVYITMNANKIIGSYAWAKMGYEPSNPERLADNLETRLHYFESQGYITQQQRMGAEYHIDAFREGDLSLADIAELDLGDDFHSDHLPENARGGSLGKNLLMDHTFGAQLVIRPD